MKKTGRIILTCILVILLTAFGACTNNSDKAAPTDEKQEATVTEAPKVTEVPEVIREYKNNMTANELSKTKVEPSEEGDKISFYDEEIDAPYGFDLLKGSSYDKTKESELYVVLGSSFNAAERAAICDYLEKNATQTLIAIRSTEGVEDIKAINNRDYVEKLPAFQSFLTDNLLGWFYENYKIDPKKICITGYETAGFSVGYALYNGNPTANYLMINPEMNKKKDNKDMTKTEEEYSSAGNTSLSANVCVVRAQEDKSAVPYGSTDKWLKALAEHTYQGFTINDVVIPGAGHYTMKTEALLKGICYFSGTEYGTKEDDCAMASKVMSKKEKDSIKVGKLSKEHEFYKEVVTADPACKDYINEISIYDEEINDTFVVHLSLPEGYDKSKKYPLVLMTDGVWRLSDHPQLRQLMLKGEVEDVILVSVGYPNGYDYFTIRERDLVTQPDLYLQFLVDNLMPYLCDNYSIDKTRVTLTGHSYGGYWALYALFHSDTIAKNTFQSYYIGSPSVQVNTNLAFAAAFEKWYYERKQELNCSVYVTVGGDEEQGFRSMIESFLDGMKEHTYKGLSMEYEVIEGYTHDTVFKPSIKNMMLKYYGVEKK
jgi:predicted alpha/beta superfamily hydrolase